MPKELGTIICPNPKCHRKIAELLVVSDTSTTPEERYYACPHCLFKLDVISVQRLKEARARAKEEPSVKPLGRKERGYSRCGAYLGYLARLPKDESMPQECLTCPKALDCVIKTSDS